MWNGPHRCPSQDASADKKLTPASDIVPSVWRPRRTDWRLIMRPARWRTPMQESPSASGSRRAEGCCQKCHSQLRLITLVETEAVAKKILKAMHLPSDIPELHPARPRPPLAATGRGDDWLN